MTKCVAAILVLVLSTGCGTIFNKNVRYVTDDTATMEGEGSVVDQKKPHRVTYTDGSTCTLEPSMSWSYFFLDLFLTGPIGIIVDAATGNWKILKGCDGVERLPPGD
jgi:hypothetical protein